MPKPITDRKLLHAKMRLDPVFWFREARNLATAAMVLALARQRNREAVAEHGVPIPTRFSKIDVGLMGSALESILKGDRARGMPTQSQPPTTASIDSAVRQISRNGHALRAIAEERGLALDEDEQVLLDDVSAVIVWRARYSLPKKIENFEEYDISDVRWEMLRRIVKRAAVQFDADIDLDELRVQTFADLRITDIASDE